MKKGIGSLVALSWFFSVSLLALGQPTSRVATIGWLAISAGPSDPAVQALRAGLLDVGYIEGRDFRLQHRSADGHLERLPLLADDLVKRHADVILTASPEATRAAMQATTAIPIVIVAHNHDPVALGLIQSFNRPGGNVTGLTVRNTQLAGKRLELLKEAIPSVSRVAVFWDSFGSAELQALKPGAESLGIQLHLIDLSDAYDLRRAFREAKAHKADAITVLGSAPLYVRSHQLGEMALENRVPLVGAYRDLVVAGGFMSYSTDIKDGFYRSAYFVDRLLKGARATELPFEQTANVKLVLNAKTAEVLGIQVPQSILLRADQVLR
jgi:putative tryptophan/tyrosine transport system substrate-binding protein